MNFESRAIYKLVDGDHEAAEKMLAKWMVNPRFAMAYKLAAKGLSIIPLCRDGKRPTRKWKKYQTQHATIFDLVEWFVVNDFSPAIVTGQLSGIMVIDCDNAVAEQACWSLGMDSPVSQHTKHGIHFIHPWAGERNTVNIFGTKGLDRRGEGGYVRAYPDSVDWNLESLKLTAVA